MIDRIDAAALNNELAALVEDQRSRRLIPGLCIGIVAGAEEIVASSGVTNVDDPRPVSTATLFQIGSITKTFVATLIMRLVETGDLHLSTPVRHWLPDFRVRDEHVASRVTLRHLLNHTAGWFGDHFRDFGRSDDALAQYVWSMDDLEQQVPLGTTYAYNNAAYSLAGRVIEVVTGRTFESAMRELLFGPLGLERTFFFADEVMTYSFAVGHSLFPGGPRVARPWALPRNDNARGGIITTVGDLLAFARSHMRDGTGPSGPRYLSPSSIRLMSSPLVTGALDEQRGLGWSIEHLQGITVIGHGGITFGQQALLWIAPEKQFALALLTNSADATQVMNWIKRWAFARFLGARSEPPSSLPLDRSAAQCVAGTYRNPANELRIAVEDERLVLYERPLEGSHRRLMLDPPPEPEPVCLAFSHPDRLIVRSGPSQDTQMEILDRDWIRFRGRLYRRKSGE